MGMLSTTLTTQPSTITGWEMSTGEGEVAVLFSWQGNYKSTFTLASSHVSNSVVYPPTGSVTKESLCKHSAETFTVTNDLYGQV